MPERTVLITGCNGLIGRSLAARVAAELPEASLLGVDRSLPQGIDGERCDLADVTATREMVSRIQPDVVFHCAGGVGLTGLDEYVAALVAPTVSLMDALIAESPSAVFVLPGSAAEYGSLAPGQAAFSEDDPTAPVSPYGVAKLAQSRSALDAVARGLDARVARVFNLIGPGLSSALLPGRVAALLASIADGQAAPRIETGPLASVRDFIDIRDACDGLIAVARRGAAGRDYNICSGVGRTSRDVVDALVAASGLEVEIVEVNGGSPRGGLDVSVGDPSRAAAELDWRPLVDFDTSARDAVEVALAGLRQ